MKTFDFCFTHPGVSCKIQNISDTVITCITNEGVDTNKTTYPGSRGLVWERWPTSDKWAFSTINVLKLNDISELCALCICKYLYYMSILHVIFFSRDASRKHRLQDGQGKPWRHLEFCKGRIYCGPSLFVKQFIKLCSYNDGTGESD